jgi:hypothetical protein
MQGNYSNRIFQNIADLLKNQGQDVETSKGLIWRAINLAHSHFVEDLGAGKVKYELDLFPGQTEYPIDSWVMKITNYTVTRPDELEFDFWLPENTNADKRVIIVDDYDNMIQIGDVLTLLCEIAVPDGYEIDEEHDPLIEKRYHRLLEEYVIAGFDKDKDRKQLFIDSKVARKIEQTYSLNRMSPVILNQYKFNL